MRFRNGLWLLLLLGLSGCDFQGNDGSVSHEWGFMTRVYADPATGVRSRYVVFVPRNHEDVEKLPVILFLNGFGENGTDGLRQISNNFGVDIWRKRDRFPFLAVCPQCSREGGWHAGGAESSKTLAILDEAVEEFGGDPDRVYLTGVSTGGYHVWTFANAHPNRFAAIVPIAAGFSSTGIEMAAKWSLPLWAFYNGRDKKTLSKSARAGRELLLEAGLSPLVTEFDRDGHNAWFSYDSPPLYAWLLRHRQSENADRKRFRLWTSDAVENQWKSIGGAKWNPVSQYEFQGTASPPEDTGLLICPQELTNGEIHLDVFLGDGLPGRVRLFSGSVDQQTCDVVITLASDGIAGVRVGTGNYSAFDPVAQGRLRREWNDIRISRNQGSLAVSLNGWPALAMADPFAEAPVQWALVATPDKTRSRWRYLRTVGAGPQIAPEE